MKPSVLAVLVSLSSPLLAQGRAPAPVKGAADILRCASSLKDRSGGPCIQASSTPTFGALLPYPGSDNAFDPSDAAVIGGGTQNAAQGTSSTIGGGKLNWASGGGATIGGGELNWASGGGATIGGGSFNGAHGPAAAITGGISNYASGYCASVSGGFFNHASGRGASVGGGYSCYATAYYSTVAGGRYNTASGEFAFIGGGSGNQATGWNSTVSGGSAGLASGVRATVPGGSWNTASGSASFAAGTKAKAVHDGAFVWGDTVDVDKSSSAADEFNVYASGGTRIFSDGTATAGVLLAPGGGSWTSVSDRDAKENFEAIDGRAVLEQLASIPVSAWNYKSQDDAIRHMGPMAQDFYAAFGLGVGETGIDTIDADGVALAAIQGLNQKVEQKDAEIAELRDRIARLELLCKSLPATNATVDGGAKSD